MSPFANTLLRNLFNAVAISLILSTFPSTRGRAQQISAANPTQKFEATLTALAPASADDCGWDQPQRTFPGDTSKLEEELFTEADGTVVAALNSSGQEPASALAKTLDSMRIASDHVNRDWPADRRFHYDLLTIPPAFVVVYHIRSRSTWSVFAVPAETTWPDKGKNTQWKQVGEDDFRYEEARGDERVEVYSLQRGPSGLTRFLSRSDNISCGDGITGLNCGAYEWNPDGVGSLQTIIERTGVEKRDDGPPYGAIGKLRTTGPTITLPYCENSAVDLYVDALLCSVDTYDVSGDLVRYVSKRTNRPDLEAVAKVVQFADARDYDAVLAYSASPEVARKMVAEMPPEILGNGSGEDYPPIRGDHQKVDIDRLHFELEKRNSRWLVVRFTLDLDE